MKHALACAIVAGYSGLCSAELAVGNLVVELRGQAELRKVVTIDKVEGMVRLDDGVVYALDELDSEVPQSNGIRSGMQLLDFDTYSAATVAQVTHGGRIVTTDGRLLAADRFSLFTDRNRRYGFVVGQEVWEIHRSSRGEGAEKRKIEAIAENGTALLDDGNWYWIHESIRPVITPAAELTVGDLTGYRSAQGGYGRGTVEHIYPSGEYILNNGQQRFITTAIRKLVQTYGNFRVGQRVRVLSGYRSFEVNITHITENGVFFMNNHDAYYFENISLIN